MSGRRRPMAWWHVASGPDAGLPGSGTLVGRSEAVASYGGTCLKVRDLLASDNAVEALRLSIPVAEQFPHGIDIHRLMGIAYLNKSDHFNARRAFDIALEGDPSDLVAQVGVAEVEEAVEGPAVALRAWRRAWEIEPGTEPIAARLREVQLRTANEGQTAPYGTAGQIDGPIPHTHASLVRTHLRSGLFEHAMLEAVTALTQDKSRTDVQLLLAEAWWRSGETEIAHNIAASILERFPFCVVANLLVALHRRVVSRDPRQQIERTREADPFDRIASSLFMGRDIPPLFDDQPVNGSWSTVRSTTGSWPVVMSNAQVRQVVNKAVDAFEQPPVAPLASNVNATLVLPAPQTEKLPSVDAEALVPPAMVPGNVEAAEITEVSISVEGSTPSSEPVHHLEVVPTPVPNVPALPLPGPDHSDTELTIGSGAAVDTPTQPVSEIPAPTTGMQEAPADEVGVATAGEGTEPSGVSEPSQKIGPEGPAPTGSLTRTLPADVAMPGSLAGTIAEPNDVPFVVSMPPATADQNEVATSGDTIAPLHGPTTSIPADIPVSEAPSLPITPVLGSTVELQQADGSPNLVPVDASHPNVPEVEQALIINDQTVETEKSVAIIDADGQTIEDLREAGALALQKRNFTEAIRLYSIAISRIRAETVKGRR